MSKLQDASRTDSVAIQAAATLIIVRNAPNGPQVLMQQRNPDAHFAGGAWVFPGGKVDASDANTCWLEHWEGNAQHTLEHTHKLLHDPERQQPRNAQQLTPDDWQRLPQTAPFSYWVAALREVFEESGVLFTQKGSHLPNQDHYRRLLLDNQLSWQALIETHPIKLAMNSLHYVSRWVTPAPNVRRYDARFFVAELPENQTPSHEDFEAIATRWLYPHEALEAFDKKEITLIPPTYATLFAMSQSKADTTQQLINALLLFFAGQEQYN